MRKRTIREIKLGLCIVAAMALGLVLGAIAVPPNIILPPSQVVITSKDRADVEHARAQAEAMREARQEAVATVQIARSSAIAAWIQVAVAFLGAGLSFYGIILVLRSLERAREANAKAHEANEIAQQAADNQLRAYLGFTKAELRNVAGNTARLHFTSKNYGSTPARQVRARIGWRSGALPTENPNFHDDQDQGFLDPGDIRLGIAQIEFPVPLAEIEAGSNGTAHIFVTIRLDYLDHRGAPHWRQITVQTPPGSTPDNDLDWPLMITPGYLRGD